MVYNTGKVKIGLRYKPPVRQHIGRSMMLLQTALLNKRQTVWQRVWTWLKGGE